MKYEIIQNRESILASSGVLELTSETPEESAMLARMDDEINEATGGLNYKLVPHARIVNAPDKSYAKINFTFSPSEEGTR